MPGKKKGKKDGKKGKGKSGKKEKDEKKDEAIGKQAERNSNIWEARLKMAEFHKEHYKDTARQLVEENTSLVDYMKQSEKDSMEVVAYLRKLDSEKDEENTRLEFELKTFREKHQGEKDILINEFNEQLNDMREKLERKTNEHGLVQNELNQLKEFRKKKIQMQKELEEIKEAMILNEKEHKDHMSRIEQKFFEEKMRLQIEANKKIEELAERAHEAAVKNLDDITKNIYKENVQLTDAFKLHNKEMEQLKKLNGKLLNENATLKGSTNGNDALVKEKVEDSAQKAKKIKELQGKVEILEKSLAQMVREFETERTHILKKCKLEMESGQIEMDKLKKTLEMKTKEMNKVKKLAKNILEQRTDIERFFLDSLDFVKKQIVTNRSEYRKEANTAYNAKMLAAHNGAGDYPKIRTFTKKFDAFSTNNVYKDLEQAEKWYDMSKLVDLTDLTWEQKEQVLRELFARMNGAKVNKKDEKKNTKMLALESKSSQNMLDKYDTDEEEELAVGKPITVSAKALANAMMNEDFTFITQSSAEADDIFMAKSALQDSNGNNSNNQILKLPSISAPI